MKRVLLARLQVVIFNEHPIAENTRNLDLFDIGQRADLVAKRFWMDGGFDQQLYNVRLLEKVFELRNTFLEPFLTYQLDQLRQPLIWLNQFESLLNDNIKLLIELGHAQKIHLLLEHLEEKRGVMVSSVDASSEGEAENVYERFDIEKVKTYCKELGSFAERKAYLLRVKTNYLQTIDPGTEGKFDKFLRQIDLERNYWQEVETYQVIETTTLVERTVPILTWNGKVNLLVDIFYQCLHMKVADGIPLISNTRKEVIELIITCFRQTNGEPFNAATVKSYLMPSRVDKRPKQGRSIDVQKLLDDLDNDDNAS